MINLHVQSKPIVDSTRLTWRERFVLLLQLQKYALPYWDKLLLRILSTMVIAVLIVLPPLLLSRVIDQALSAGNTRMLYMLGLAGLATAVVLRVLSFIAGAERHDGLPLPGDVMSSYMMSKIALEIKARFYKHVQSLHMGFYASRPVGEHMFRSTLDCDDTAFLASEVMPKVFAAVQRIVVLFFVLQTFGGELVLAVTAYLCLFFTIKHLLANQVRYWDRRYREETQRLEAVCREVLFPWKLVKSYTRERTVRRWYGTQAIRAGRAYYGRMLFIFYDVFYSLFSLNVFLSFVTLIVGILVFKQEMSLGEFAAAGMLIAQAVRPFEAMITTLQLIRQKLVPAERLLETLGVAPEVVDPEVPKRIGHVTGRVELENVFFSYIDGLPVLKDVSLEANPGERIALVGPTGAGKSTLTSLIVRLYDPEEGRILLDDIDLRDMRQEDVRRPMAIVTQTVNTFSETIARNILYGNPRASREEMLEAARLARVDEFAERLAGGYDTVLSEGGSLSGGQKQRLCLARALVRNPKILILDEATSALDPVTEKEVVGELDVKFADATRIVVAHNVFSARNADRVYVMDKGRIVACGTHDELMQAGGLYPRLWSTEPQETGPT